MNCGRDRPDEKNRVEAAGGFVMNIGGVWRATNHSGGMVIISIQKIDEFRIRNHGFVI